MVLLCAHRVAIGQVASSLCLYQHTPIEPRSLRFPYQHTPIEPATDVAF
jgi:hypothetical protein